MFSAVHRCEGSVEGKNLARPSIVKFCSIAIRDVRNDYDS